MDRNEVFVLTGYWLADLIQTVMKPATQMMVAHGHAEYVLGTLRALTKHPILNFNCTLCSGTETPRDQIRIINRRG